MKEKLFKANQFTPTQWSTAEDKAKFANQFVRLIERGFQKSDFPRGFYNRLSMIFGHIAHCNHLKFWEIWFLDKEAQLEFLQHTEQSRIYGNPTFTYSDVEEAIQGWLKSNPQFAKNLETSIAVEHEQHDRSEYERLKVKFA